MNKIKRIFGAAVMVSIGNKGNKDPPKGVNMNALKRNKIYYAAQLAFYYVKAEVIPGEAMSLFSENKTADKFYQILFKFKDINKIEEEFNKGNISELSQNEIKILKDAVSSEIKIDDIIKNLKQISEQEDEEEWSDTIDILSPPEPEKVLFSFADKGDAAILEKKPVLLAADSDVGKSTFLVQLAVYAAIGLPVIGLQPTKQCKALLAMYEDFLSDYHRKIYNNGQYLLSTNTVSENQLKVVNENIRFANHKMRRFLLNVFDGKNIRENDAKKIADYLNKNKFDIFIIDPLFCLIEDLKEDARALIEFIYFLQQTTDVTVICAHHVRKSEKNTDMLDALKSTIYGSVQLSALFRLAITINICSDLETYAFKFVKGNHLGWDRKGEPLWARRNNPYFDVFETCSPPQPKPAEKKIKSKRDTKGGRVR